MTTTVASPRARTSFSRLEHVLDLPNLIDIQKASFQWFKNEGLRETIDDISPIEDYTGTLAVEFGEFEFGDPQFSIKECREKDLTYQASLNMKVRFVNKDTGEIREQGVFMGDFPMMTEFGTFIINGTERVIVTQLVRSPGAYLMEPKDPTKQVFTANLMPSRGSWLELEIDKKGIVYARIDRKRKLPITTLLRALPAEDPTTGFALDTSSNEAILALFDNSHYIVNTLDKDPSTREEEALIEVFKKQRPGEPPTLDNARNLLRALFFDPKRYDLTKVGRYKLNQRLGVDVPEDVRVLTTEDIVSLVRKLLELPVKIGIPEDSKDFAAEGMALSRAPIVNDLDEYEHFGNRRLRTVGELIQEAFRVGLYRMERVVRERMTTEDVDTITPQTIINIRPVVAALKEFFGSSQLSQFMDQTNSLAGLTHRRRLSALGAGGLTRERAPIEVRDVHPTHYGRMCPIETPEGPNIGLIGYLASYATVSEFGFVQTPYRKVVERQGHRRDRLSRRRRGVALRDRAGERAARQERQVRHRHRPLPLLGGRGRDGGGEGRRPDGRLAGADRLGLDGADPVPRAQRREPRADGREHAAPGRAAARAPGAARRHRPRVPRRGRLRRRRRHVTAGHGRGRRRRARRRRDEGRQGRLHADEVHALEPGHAHPPQADRAAGRQAEGRRRARRRQLDGQRRARARREPPRCVHAVRGLQLRGRDRHLGAGRQGRHPHVDPHPRVRDRRALDQARRRGDHARHPEPLGGVAVAARRARRRAHRRRGRCGRPARGQGHAEGRDRADGRGEADPRDLQGEGARGPRHEPQGAARRGRRRDRRQDVLSRGRRRPVAGRERARSRLRRHQAQDRRRRQARGTPRQQGRHLEDRPRGRHAVPAGRPAGRHRPQPARRAEPDEHRPGARDAPRLGCRARRVRRGRGHERREERRRRLAPSPPDHQRRQPERGRDARLRRRDAGRRRRSTDRVDEAEPRLADQVPRRPEAAGRAASARGRRSSTTAAAASRSSRRSRSATCTS